MSAEHVYHLRCDGLLDERAGTRCASRFPTEEEQAGGSRRAAARVGWSTERAPSPNGFFYVYDFCPGCTRAAKELNARDRRRSG